MDQQLKNQAPQKSEQGKNLILLVLVLLVLISGAKLYLDYLEKNKQERLYAESNYVNSNEVALMKKKKNSFIMMEVRRA